MVRVWDWLLCLSEYGKVYKKITTKNNFSDLIEIGIQKMLIDFIESGYFGTITYKNNNITILYAEKDEFTHYIKNTRVEEIFTKNAKKIDGCYKVRKSSSNDSKFPSEDISPEFRRAIMELKNKLNTDCEIYSFLQIIGKFF